MSNGNGTNTGQGAFWDARYEQEGHIWGDEPSETAAILASNLSRVSEVLEVGFGYGRDLKELVQRGHIVAGIEESLVGLNEAVKQLREDGLYNNNVSLTLGEFSRAPIAQETFQAVLSHRVLHLLKTGALVRAFADAAARVLKPDGFVCVSARDARDFNAQQMKWITQGTLAEYTIAGREGHRIRFWDEARFKEIFSAKFHNFQFAQREEAEAQTNEGVKAHFTIMVAEKKPVELYNRSPEQRGRRGVDETPGDNRAGSAASGVAAVPSYSLINPIVSASAVSDSEPRLYL